MTRDEFTTVVADVLDSLPEEFRKRIRNVAVLVEDYPPGYEPVPRRAPRPRGQADLATAGQRPALRPRKLLLGQYIGIPATQRSVFDLRSGPDHIVLYQKNIEAVCRNEQELREQIKLTVMHELGHYFGMSEEQLRDV